MSATAREVIAGYFSRYTKDEDVRWLAADRLLTALRAAGFAVVPTMPTERMELSGDEDRSSAAAVWFAMLKAAQGGTE